MASFYYIKYIITHLQGIFNGFSNIFHPHTIIFQVSELKTKTPLIPSKKRLFPCFITFLRITIKFPLNLKASSQKSHSLPSTLVECTYEPLKKPVFSTTYRIQDKQKIAIFRIISRKTAILNMIVILKQDSLSNYTQISVCAM